MSPLRLGFQVKVRLGCWEYMMVRRALGCGLLIPDQVMGEKKCIVGCVVGSVH